ncbi:hypothetical protein CYLTODRAFT_373104 [Cylindrobasidium torrendii FP15055 ss-10]|uniref:HSF-type DNA-binding domain-containing protein n=1 Tax=Cylindrobasidium torrendii FP15055 ss-10 TaxID=1314674 RepID=A0A0D7BFC1_9AGAR|nr:hypothetical protein CYLTODRAFT_373104 [Cylindrobasidium torrendii FP15055 ss-10]
MTAQNQVALTGTFQTNVNKIPPFPQKLYQIVNDEKTDPIIEWSEEGNSFYIHNQSKLESDILPYWFKTNRMSAFVRQLNKYGFRKVTHLQQGVLKRDAEAEVAQYHHPNFCRGGEAQLALIHEAKKVKKDQLLVEAGSTEDLEVNMAPSTVTNRQSLDVNTILADIRRNQSRISQELSDLRGSDQALWAEANRSLQRYQQQQTTINLIVQFLGNLLSQMGKDKKPSTRSPVPVQQQRLMIEGSERTDAHGSHHPQHVNEHHHHQPSGNASIMEVVDDDDESGSNNEPIVETPPSTAPPNPSTAAPSPTSELPGGMSYNQLMRLSDGPQSPGAMPFVQPPDFDWSSLLPLNDTLNDPEFTSLFGSLQAYNTVPPLPDPQESSALQAQISEIEKSAQTTEADISTLSSILAGQAAASIPASPSNAPLPDDLAQYINIPLSPMLQDHAAPATEGRTRGQKRKSDVVDAPDMTGSTPVFSVNASVPKESITRKQQRR